MTAEEMSELKLDAESRITEILTELEKETGCEVLGLDLGMTAAVSSFGLNDEPEDEDPDISKTVNIMLAVK